MKVSRKSHFGNSTAVPWILFGVAMLAVIILVIVVWMKPSGSPGNSTAPAGSYDHTSDSVCTFDNAPINIAWNAHNGRFSSQQQWRSTGTDEPANMGYCTSNGGGKYPVCDNLSDKVKTTDVSSVPLAGPGGPPGSTQKNCETFCSQQYPCGLEGNVCYGKKTEEGCQCRLCPGAKITSPIAGLVKSAPCPTDDDGTPCKLPV